MTLDGPALLGLLPALYRQRDAENGGALARLADVLAEQLQVLQEDMAQLYDDQFIETCADWVVPYIGDLIGYRQLNGVTPGIASPRAEVADTLRLRRGKGTLAVLEGLARDVTGWDAHVVEYFALLCLTQSVKHVRPGRGGTVGLRQQRVLDRIGSAFDRSAHTADLRGLGGNGGRWNLNTVGIHLWRLSNSGLSRASAFGVDAQRFLFDPLGADTPLVNRPLPRASDAVLASEANLPLPIGRRALADDLAAIARGQAALFYGPDAAIFIEGLASGTRVLAADLSDLGDGGGGGGGAGQPWAHEAAPGTLLLDPQRGRMAFADAQATAPRVWFRRAGGEALGGGEYDRLASLNLALQPVSQVQPGDVQAALDAVAGGGAAEWPDSATHAETPTLALAANAVVELRAADQTRPLLQMTGALQISGAAGAELTLNGLVIAGGALRVTAGADGQPLRRLRLVHCTLVPGITLRSDGSASQPGAASLVVETAGTLVELDHCIVGALRLHPLASLRLDTCIVDAGDAAGVALAGLDDRGPGAPLQASGSTLIGRVHSAWLQAASNSIFMARNPLTLDASRWPATVWSERRQDGCVRFCWLPADSLVPRRYRCQPADDRPAPRLTPMFDSLRYGDAAYARLSRRCAPEITAGAEDGAAMGVQHQGLAEQRERNLRLRLAEYLKAGLDGGLLFAD